ncbi:DC-STAMP domain-containing protein 2 [Schistocerca cancellata]|uniref:DC-STAMP domain-containing protein 2 n=1 Tax=Schistocerca cancellata TaxID=274614 RepID=UPI002118664C|nr:DC-STAMP domain-containing protein 2 [Schistocerca cancellata]
MEKNALLLASGYDTTVLHPSLRICSDTARWCQPGTRFGKFWHKLLFYGTLENYVMTSCLGFFGGMLLTYILFMFFVFQLHFSTKKATILCSMIGTVLTLGLAFSYYVRCIVVLVLPQLCVNRGRQALMLYAFVLTLTGPGKNTMQNVGVLAESLSCGQEQLKIAAKKIMEAIKKPFLAMKDALSNAMKTIKSITLKIKDTLLSIKRVVMSVLRVIKSAASWLGSIINICNKELGTPFERCMRVFEPAISDCVAALGPLFSWLCSIVYVGQALCFIFKVLDLICALVDLIKDTVTGPIKKKLREFLWRLKNIFYVSVDFKHSYDFETEQSKTLKEVAAEITAEVKERAAVISSIFDKISLVASLFFLIIFFRAVYYWRKYMTNDKYDNRYITKEFYKLDENRSRLGHETILPLKNREKRKYITMVTLRLSGSEKLRLTRSVSFVIHITIKILILMAYDYCLYWILDKIHQHGRFTSKIQDPQVVDVNVKGTGFLASIYRNVMGAFKPFDVNAKVDTIPCLPHPLPPNYMRYMQIGFIVLLCLILSIIEPYVLRLRQWFMGYYYPQRAKQRAVWLYNRILRSRENFLKFARRHLRRKFGKGKRGGDEESFFTQLWQRCALLQRIIPHTPQKACLVCAETQGELKSCPKLDCAGTYCHQCFKDLKNICTICMEPIEYGDLTDVSEEKGSSEEENTTAGVQNGASKADHGKHGEITPAYPTEYQYDTKSVSGNNSAPFPSRPRFKDLEAQKILDVATVRQFPGTDDEKTEESDADKRKHKEQISRHITGVSIPQRRKVRFAEEEIPLLSSRETKE